MAAVPEQPIDIRQAVEQHPCADVVADLPGGDEEIEVASLAVADRMQFGVHAALGAANQAATPPFSRPPFHAHAGRCPVRFQVGCVDHHGLCLTVIGRQAHHHPREDALFAPTLPAIVECLVRAVFPWRVSPP